MSETLSWPSDQRLRRGRSDLFDHGVHDLVVERLVVFVPEHPQVADVADGGGDTPSLVILDINMPRMNGLELLTKLRADKSLHHLIVFVLTTSNDEQDKFDAYNLNVAGYMLKSDMGSSFIKSVQLVEMYWKVIEFPTPSAVAA